MGNNVWRRRAVVVGALVLGAGAGVGVSVASSPGDEPTNLSPSVNVEFAPVSPQKQVFNGNVNASATKRITVSGGSTTVPTNATTVQMVVSVTGSQAGTLTFYPAGDPAGSSGQQVTWTAGASNSGTIATDLGLKNQVAIVNSSAGSAKVNVKLVGYSTQVTSGDVSSLGSTSGQVLTDTGTGADWQPPQLPAAHFARNAGFLTLTSNYQTVVSVTVPAGTYLVSAMTSAYGNNIAGEITCTVFAPAQGLVGQRFAQLDSTIYSAGLSIEGLVQTGGGTIALQCYRLAGNVQTHQSTIVATRVGSTSGPIVS